MIARLVDNPLLLFFMVAALGYLLGRVRIGNVSLGVAAVLFVGLAVGAVHPDLKLPEFAYLLGLVLFVYTVGLASGPGFVSSLRRHGFRLNLLAASVLIGAACLVFAGASALGMSGPRSAGLFAGSVTNTPTLAAVLETLEGTHGTSKVPSSLATQPVVGFALAYPFGVLGVLLAMSLARRLVGASNTPNQAAPMASATAAVAAGRAGLSIGEVRREGGLDVVFVRLRRGADERVATEEERLLEGDLVSLVGSPASVESAILFLGSRSDADLADDRHLLDFRRMFVSRADATLRPLSALGLAERFGAVVTRVRRGDVDLVARPDTVLQLGDRVRVVAPAARLGELARFFGDSYRALSEVDIVSFGLGIGLGLLLGQIPIPLPFGGTFRLGYAGGPLLMALFLGNVGRTGPLVWALPASANQTLRQFGVVLFLAGVGTRSGYAFAKSLHEGGALFAMALGAGVTFTVASTALWIGHKVLKVPFGVLLGVVAGIHTQPAALAFASEAGGEEQANEGYATVFPLATVTKILLAQALLSRL
jgi:putative transport protein